MKKVIKSAVALLAAISMIPTNTSVFAGETAVNRQVLGNKVEVKNEEQSNDNTVSDALNLKGEYAEGQAIIMYQSTSNKLKSFQNGGLGEDFKIT